MPPRLRRTSLTNQVTTTATQQQVGNVLQGSNTTTGGNNTIPITGVPVGGTAGNTVPVLSAGQQSAPATTGAAGTTLQPTDQTAGATGTPVAAAGDSPVEKKWYEQWYVWAIAGVVVIAGTYFLYKKLKK